MAVAAFLGSFVLVACSSPSGPAAGSGQAAPASSSGTPMGTPIGTAEAGAAWERTADFAGTGTTRRPVQVRLYPLQRLRNRVLLVADLRAEQSTPAFSPFCAGAACADLSGISLIDTGARIRIGPLRSGQTGPMMTSSTRGFAMKAGMTYRFGALFADPGTSTVAVDLQQAGVAPGVPIGSGLPPANLISTQPPGTGPWNPAAVTRGTLVTAPLPAMTGRFQANRHLLAGRIAGGTVNDAPGMVSISADAIFTASSAAMRSTASGVIARAADLLVARADPSSPLPVVAYTDSTGSTALSRRQANAVSTALAARLKKFTLVPRGAGSADPVAANTTSMRQDSPAGRALNRRIEVSYRSKTAAGSSYIRPAAPVMPTGLPGPKGPGAPGGPPAPSGPHGPIGPSVPAAPTPLTSSSMTATMTASATPMMTPITAAPSVSGSASPAPVLDVIKVGPAQVERGSNARFTAGIVSVRVYGGMTLVNLLIRADRPANPIGVFSIKGGGRTNIGAFHLIGHRTGQVFVPAFDAHNPDRIAGTFTHPLEAGIPYQYAFFTTALPADLTAVDVALAGLGTAQAVPIVRINS